MNKLKLKWVIDEIGEDYKKWRKGDIVKIQAQTGTGKTYFIKKVLIPHMKDHERLLYICNRTNLKRQLKVDLLEQLNRPIPYLKSEKGEYILYKNNKILDVDTLDKITEIGDITITSYHAIQNGELDKDYKLSKYYQTSEYDYIIMDECHYLLADGGFNAKVRIAFNKLIMSKNRNSIKILISATMEELKYPILHMCEGYLGKQPKLWEYTTGVDYSYVNIKYFTGIKDIISTIKNDTTDEKWLIFVTKLKDATEIQEEFGEDICAIVKAGDKTEELNNIISNSKFECKILCATKAMDNGINLNDDKLTNIVIMSWDRITFMQMLGRKRIDINDAQEVNLYIPTRYKKSFINKLKDCTDKQLEVDLFKADINLFNRKYDNDLKKIGEMQDLFYRDNMTKEWGLNLIGNRRLQLDIKAFENTILEFDTCGKFAFVLEQLHWLELTGSFDKANYIENVISNDEIQSLEKYLESIVGQRLYSDEQQTISDLIIKELITVADGVDYRTKKLKPSTLENILRVQLNLHYAVSTTKREDKVIDGKRISKSYIIVNKII
ncbi:DEAD/DEAH box helicase family protein [Clostridium sp. FP1]|uniref:DEAD/DEAH box helicase family protein n=1 Tax=Clostridium sp. FP1 TaxID=2724076 RepID=UPI0013E94E04|nr:DEAD/DEAH box helicase family protein [Clostridium sp. FP1]MBZ9635523.1 DEAD/DEAH box helicase family protein [Clostridium sp. FP1]